MHPAALIKVRMTTRLLRTDPRSRIKHQQRIQQIQSFIPKVVNQRDLLISDPLREARLEVREGSNARPFCFGRCAEDAEDLEDFVDFGVAGEEGLARAHLGEDAADGPHVDACAIGAAAEEDFG